MRADYAEVTYARKLRTPRETRVARPTYTRTLYSQLFFMISIPGNTGTSPG